MRKLATMVAAVLAMLARPAAAQDWPARPITLGVPYAAGGPNDTIARVLSGRLAEILNGQIIIENVGGAGGMTGANRVAKAAPDGYTLLLGGLAVLAQVPNLYKRPLYNAFRPTRSRNSSPTPKPIRRNCNIPPRAADRADTCAPSCSIPSSAPASPTFPIGAPGRPCRT